MPVSDSSTSLLLKAATPDLYRRNAFRLTGLPVTASAREVARQADKLKMLADLGGQAAQQLSVIPGMEPPTAEEVRQATQRLKDVEARALDEFFWFWPEDWESPESDEAFAAIKRHDLDAAFTIWASREVETESFIASRNIALVLHMRSIEWALLDFTHPLDADRLEKVHDYWKEAFDRWEWLADDDRLWDAFRARIRQINDPALTTGYARRLRSELPQAFDKINAELALTYAEKGRRAEAQWHVDFLKSTHSGSDDTESVIENALMPTRARIERAMETAYSAAKKDKKTGVMQARKLLDTAEPLLAVFDVFHVSDSVDRCHICDEVAQAAMNCAVTGYNATEEKSVLSKPTDGLFENDFTTVLRRLRVLAKSDDLCGEISEALKTARNDLQFECCVKPLIEKAAQIRDDTGINVLEKLNLLAREVLPNANGLMHILPEELQNQFCDAIAGILRGLAIDACEIDSMPGQTESAIRVPVVEGESELSDRNRLIGVLDITGAQIRRELPEGQEIEVTLRIDESRKIMVEAFVPYLDEDFSKELETGRKAAANSPQVLRERLAKEQKRLESLKNQADEAEDRGANKLLGEIDREDATQELRRRLRDAEGDFVAGEQCDKMLLDLACRLDEVEAQIKWPALVKEVRSLDEELQDIAKE